MKKRCLWALIASVLFWVLSLTINAKTYVDDFINTVGDDIKSYHGFASDILDFALFSGWATCEDSTVLSMIGQTATVVYRVRGAETVRVDLYAENSTLAFEWPGDLFYLGMSQTGGTTSDANRSLYDSAQDMVFTIGERGIYTLRRIRSGLAFKNNGISVNMDSGYYGVNIAASTDGKSFIPIKSASLEALQFQSEGYGTYWKESYVAQPPARTTHVKVTVQGYRNMKLDAGGVGDPMPIYTLLSAKVVFEGARLEVGQPQQSSSEPEPSSSVPSSSQPESSSSAPSSSKPESSSSVPSSSQPESSSSVPSSSQPESSSSTPSSSESEITASNPSSISSKPDHNRPSSNDGYNEDYKRSDWYDAFTGNTDSKFNTYNGNGDNRAAIRKDTPADQPPYKQPSYTPAQAISEETYVQDAPIVHTNLGGAKKTQRTADVTRSVTMISSTTALSYLFVQAVLRLRR